MSAAIWSVLPFPFFFFKYSSRFFSLSILGFAVRVLLFLFLLSPFFPVFFVPFRVSAAVCLQHSAVELLAHLSSSPLSSLLSPLSSSPLSSLLSPPSSLCWWLAGGRRQEGSDVDTRRRITVDFVKGLLVYFQTEVAHSRCTCASRVLC